LNFTNKSISISKSADNNTRIIREKTKTNGSTSHATDAVRLGSRASELLGNPLEAQRGWTTVPEL
jgi:hypothetical protein